MVWSVPAEADRCEALHSQRNVEVGDTHTHTAETRTEKSAEAPITFHLTFSLSPPFPPPPRPLFSLNVMLSKMGNGKRGKGMKTEIKMMDEVRHGCVVTNVMGLRQDNNSSGLEVSGCDHVTQ